MAALKNSISKGAMEIKRTGRGELKMSVCERYNNRKELGFTVLISVLLCS